MPRLSTAPWMGRVAVQSSTTATTTRSPAGEENRRRSLPPPSDSDAEALSARKYGSHPCHGQSYGCWWIAIPQHDRECSYQIMQSGQFVCVRSRAFLLAGLLSLEVNDQRKRIRCDVANVFLDTVFDKYGEPLCCFLSLHRKRGACQSLPSNRHNA